MPKQQYICINKECQIHRDAIVFPEQRECYSCHQPLVKKQKVLSPREADIVNNYPYVIAHQYYNFLHEENTSARKELLRDVFEFSLRYLALLILSEYFNSTLKVKEINNSFEKNLKKRSSIGDLEDFIRDAIPALILHEHSFFINELPDFYDSLINPENGKIKKYVIITENNITDEYGETSNIVKPLTALESLREEFRNKRFAHGSYLSEKQNLKILKLYSPILLDFIEAMGFLKNYPMLKWDIEKCYELTGSGKPTKLNYKEELDKDDPLWIINKKTSERFKLAPFFILPKKHINEVSDDVQLFYYMDFTEDLVRFRSSPNNESGNTSGVLLKKLKTLIEEKKINPVLHTHDTLTESIFTTKVFKYSKTQIAQLGDEDGTLKKIYQSRDDVEVDLKSWLGSKYGLFIISAMAGSGKTFLLANLFKEKIYKNFLIDINGVYKPKYEPLIIRANRLSTPLIEREIKYALNLHPEFDFNYLSNDLGYNQSEPFVILIDAGNEHNEPNLFIDEILKFIKKYSEGFIKIVLTWRADLKNELPVVSDDYDQYIYAKVNDSEQKHLLAKKAYILRPFNHKELEEAWFKYTEDKVNPLNPKFSWEELNFFDKNLISELANPLHLKLFLESFNGKSLPKSNGYYNFWKEWTERFTRQEYEFLLLLVEVIFEEKMNKLPSAVYYNHPKIENSINDINGPFEKLKAKEVLTQYHSNSTRYLTFTVESFYNYMLGEYLYSSFEDKSNKELLKLWNTSKLRGIKRGIQNLLIIDLTKDDYSRLSWFIDNIENDNDLINLVYPLTIGFLIKDVKSLMNTLFKSPTRNDLVIIQYVTHFISHLYIEKNKEILNFIDTYVDLNNDVSIILKLKASRLLNENKRLMQIEEVEEKILMIPFEDFQLVGIYRSFSQILYEFAKEKSRITEFESKIEDYLKKSLMLSLKLYGETNYETALIYHNLANLYYDCNKKINEALQLANNAIKIRRIVDGDCWELAIHYALIGLIHLEMQNYNKAIENTLKALELTKNQFGENHIDISTYYWNLSLIYDEMENISEAQKNDVLACLSYWNNTYQKMGGPAYKLYSHYKTINQDKEAIKWLEQSYLVRKERLGDEDERAINTFKELVEYAKELNDEDMLKKWSKN